MNELEIKTILNTLQIAGGVWYDHFVATPSQPTPTLPFILYRVNNVDTKKGDDMVIHQENDYIVEFCSELLDTATEKLIEKVLNDNHLSYDKTRDYIYDQRMFQTTYLF